MQISACIITLNEERNIERCLNSLIGLVDEIIIVDSGSTDKTKEIAEKFGARFEHIAWKGYAETKNTANKLANYEYVLSLDADEALSTALQKSITKVKAVQDQTRAYSFNRLTNYCGTWIKYAGWYPDRKVRLFPKDNAKWIGDFVHEKLELNSEIYTVKLEGDLLHYSYYSKEEHISREKKYAKLAAEQALANNKRISSLKAYSSALSRFTRMYIIELGFIHGKKGFNLCKISAQGKIWKYRYLMDAIRSQA